MTTNESTTDRALRIFAGVLLIGLAVSGTTAWGWIGIVPLLTGLAGNCPVYSILGISTCPAKSPK
ncbi:MAG: hypothetical protein RLZZ84_627 [Pseudomonadota bacterium]|jgi:hypothetical protein